MHQRSELDCRRAVPPIGPFDVGGAWRLMSEQSFQPGIVFFNLVQGAKTLRVAKGKAEAPYEIAVCLFISKGSSEFK